MESPRDTGDSVWPLVAAAAVLAVALFASPLALDTPLLDPDEGLHASIAQEMVERGDWVTPRLFGEPFLDKPILYFWAEAASLATLGMNAAAVRLPGLLFGLLGMVTTGAVAWRMFGRLVGVVAAMFYATLLLPTGLAQFAAHDVALVPWVSLSILLFWEADRAESRRGRVGCTLVIGVLLGLACLTKGLVGVGLVGTAYGSYLLVTRRLTVAACVRGAAALGVAALTAGVWYAAMEARNPGYLHYYFVDRHLLGLATSSQKHGSQPWWYYLPLLVCGGLPWILYLPAGLIDWWAIRRRHRSASGLAHPGAGPPNEPRGLPPRPAVHEPRYLSRRPAGAGTSPAARRHGGAGCAVRPDRRGDKPRGSFLKMPRGSLSWMPRLLGSAGQARGQAPRLVSDGAATLVICWLVACTLLLSLAGSKLVTYIWPVFPAVAILAAVVWTRLFEGKLADAARRMVVGNFLWSCATGVLLVPGIMLVACRVFDFRLPWHAWALGMAAGVSSWVPLAFWLARRPRGALASGTLSVAAQFAVVMALVVPQVARDYTARDLARHFNRTGRVPSRVAIVEERVGSLVFYLRPELRTTLQAGQLEPVRAMDLAERLEAGPVSVIAVADDHVDAANEQVDLAAAPFRRAGRYRVYRPSQLTARQRSVGANAVAKADVP